MDYLQLDGIMVDLAVKMNNRQQRLFACDCAEHVLPIFESCYPGDDRPREFIEIMRQSASRELADNELEKAKNYARALEGEAFIDSAGFVVYAAISTASFNLHAVYDVNKSAISAIFVVAREKGNPEPFDKVVEFKKWQIQRAQAILDGLYDQE